MLPADHAAPDAYQAGILDPVAAQIAAHAAYLGIAAEDLLDHPVDPAPEDRRRTIEIHGGEEVERFADAGHPFSRETTAEVLLVLRVGRTRGDGYRAALFDLRARLRAVLLQDPDFALGRLIREVRTSPYWDGGKLAVGVATMTLAIGGYVTEYPPAGLPDLEAARLTIDAADPTDPNLAPDGGPDGRPEAELDIDLSQ